LATAARSTANYNTYFTHALEEWINQRSALDIVFPNKPLLHIIDRVCGKSQELGKIQNERLLESKVQGIKAFHYYDTLNKNTAKGAQAATFSPWNYAGPMQMSWEEELEFTSPGQIASRLEEYGEQLLLSVQDVLGSKIYIGNAVDTKDMVGLEQALFAESHINNSGIEVGAGTGNLAYINDEWRARQATNSYGGITRTAFTAREVGGTGWEHVAISGEDDTTAMTFGYLSTGDPNTALVALGQLYDFTTWGTVGPNLIVSGQKPYDHYTHAAQAKQTIYVEPGQWPNVNLGSKLLKYMDAVWIRDRYSDTQNASSYSDANLAAPNIYMLNTAFIKWLRDPRAWFKLLKPRSPDDQLASVRHMVVRGNLIFTSPRQCGRYFNYGETF
jgi:hypothetical protein